MNNKKYINNNISPLFYSISAQSNKFYFLYFSSIFLSHLFSSFPLGSVRFQQVELILEMIELILRIWWRRNKMKIDLEMVKPVCTISYMFIVISLSLSSFLISNFLQLNNLSFYFSPISTLLFLFPSTLLLSSLTNTTLLSGCHCNMH